MVTQPQFLLFCDTHTSQSNSSVENAVQNHAVHGRWHFVLDRLDSPGRLEATDAEPAIHPDRLALLSVVRGLEALDEPSSVNLVTTSRYVSRGLKYGLASWRNADYQWEHFGVQRPVRNADLWQRVDRAMQFHGLTCRLLPSQIAATESIEEEQIVSDEMHGLFPAHANRVGAEHSRPAWQPERLDTAQPELAAVLANDYESDGVERRQLGRAARYQTALSTNNLNRSVQHATNAPTRLISEQRLQTPPATYNWVALVSWWELALTWIKWWRRRSQPRPAAFGL